MPIFEDLTLESPDKVKIKAYLMLRGASASGTDLEEAKKRPTILFLHANAGNMVGSRCLASIQAPIDRQALLM